jgi:poly(hydroxyalkanoate) depolymerase family esterase
MTDFNAAMRKAASLTRSYNLLEATRVIQDALAGREPGARGTQATQTLPLLLAKPEANAAEDRGNDAEQAPKTDAARLGVLSRMPAGKAATPSQRPRKPLGEMVRLLREGQLPAARGLLDRAKQLPEIEVPPGAQYVTRSFSCADGTRSYKLYIPAAQPRGLVVMLHGCHQSPDDFAIGTAMNDVAESNGLLVAYPHQTKLNNPSSCWNWFRPDDQMRGQGEPAALAGIAREVASEFGLRRDRTFVAGLSAGGAMAMVMAETYPDVFGAVGVHSGLDYQSASDVASAFAAMRGTAAPQGALNRARSTVRTIVFHGALDQTVHPSNADRISDRLQARYDNPVIQRGPGYTRTTFGPAKAPLLEQWSVDGLGHAWSGGNSAGSFTDARGPNASAEMVRFFVG